MLTLKVQMVTHASALCTGPFIILRLLSCFRLIVTLRRLIGLAWRAVLLLCSMGDELLDELQAAISKQSYI